ncbi:MAG: nucleotide exchange factor GrpE [Firmicutes bacterium HGW-Firmicutes-16]|nr:MAG: nucleotide exchange factor GrpE [Firmicutes bacterium HGW-Firmicutes-16]
MGIKKTSDSKEEKDGTTAEKAFETSEINEKTEETKSDKKTDKIKDRMSEELKKAQEELSSEKEKYLRMLAEYDNFRKRSQKERESTYSDVRADTVTRFLPVYDNLERALKTETADEAYRRGVEMTLTQFKETIEKLGVSEIEAGSGTKFDPEIHNAVMHVEDENFGEGIITEEFQKGFKLGDKVIRCSIVKVAN